MSWQYSNLHLTLAKVNFIFVSTLLKFTLMMRQIGLFGVFIVKIFCFSLRLILQL
jgi:hypothetical protein